MTEKITLIKGDFKMQNLFMFFIANIIKFGKLTEASMYGETFSTFTIETDDCKYSFSIRREAKEEETNAKS